MPVSEAPSPKQCGERVGEFALGLGQGGSLVRRQWWVRQPGGAPETRVEIGHRLDRAQLCAIARVGMAGRKLAGNVERHAGGAEGGEIAGCKRRAKADGLRGGLRLVA